MSEESVGVTEIQPGKGSRIAVRRRLCFFIPIIVVVPAWIIICLMTGPRPDVAAAIAFSGGILLASSLGFWLGLGVGWWRFWIVALLSPLLGLMVGINQRGQQIEFQSFFLVIVVVVAVTAFGLRVGKGQLKFTQSDDTDEDALQFGIRDLIIVTTIVAAVAAFGPSAVRWL